jgi:hypothetical protein
MIPTSTIRKPPIATATRTMRFRIWCRSRRSFKPSIRRLDLMD